MAYMWSRVGRAVTVAVALLLVGTVISRAEGVGTFACPMHPDVRQATPGTCPRCAMTLVRSDADQVAPYRVDLDIQPAGAPADVPLDLTFVVRDPARGAIVRDLEIVHQQPMHVFVADQDLAWFAHVHPQPTADGAFALQTRLPHAGPYLVVADFVPRGGPPQLIERTLISRGYRGPLRPARLPRTAQTEARDGGLVFTLGQARLVATQRTTVEIEVRDDRGAAPALEPYLGADVHVVAISADRADVVHAHGDRVGPGRLRLELCLPRPGAYRVWAQVQQGGAVRTARFTVQAAEMAAAVRSP